MRFNFGYKRLMQICFGQHSYGGPNVISKAIAYAKLFSRSHAAVIRAYYLMLPQACPIVYLI